MKTILLTSLVMMTVSCGEIKKAADAAEAQAKKDAESTETDSDVKTGSRTVTKSVTTTVKESGDQSVLKDVDQDEPEIDDAKKDVKPIVIVESPIVGTWFEACDDGIAYKKVFGKDGTLKIYTYVFDDQYCESQEAQMFVQRMKYKADDKYVRIGQENPIEINVSGDNNTVIFGDQELQKH